ncbi:MAG: Ku protein [Bryobacteraceae bacterium]
MHQLPPTSSLRSGARQAGPLLSGRGPARLPRRVGQRLRVERARYVVVEDDELDQMAPPSSRVMEVREFVPTAEVDPVYLDASYYVVPEDASVMSA